MNAKEKAEELILKFMRLQEPNYNWFHSKLAKQCALIAVEEIMSTIDAEDHIILYNYWQKVRAELQSL